MSKYAWVACAVVVVASLGLLLYRLGVEPLQDYDEATYAEVATESLQSHDYLSFTFLDLDYFNKPPLLFWLMDVSQSVVHETEAAARLPSALSGILLTLLVMVLVYEATGNGYAAALGGSILLTTSAFIEPARQARFDILVSLCIIASVYAFLRAFQPRKRYWFLWFGAFAGLTVLAKGPLLVYAIPPILGILLIYRRLSWLKDPYFWGGAAIFLAVIVPWHVYESVQFGSTFWNIYLYGQIVQRVQHVLFTLQPTNYGYWLYMAEFAAPWIYVFFASLVAAPFLWRRMSQESKAVLIASILGVFSVVAVCFGTKTKAFSYLIPLYPFMAAAIALIGYQSWNVLSRRLKPVLLCTIGIFLVFGLYLSVYNGFHINGYYASEVSLAEQEKTIAQTLVADHAPTFYTYDTTTLGSIMFYSRLIKPMMIVTGTQLPQGSFVLSQTSQLSKLQSLYPKQHLATLYKGAILSLEEIKLS